MKTSSSRGSVTRILGTEILGTIVVVSLLSGLSSFAALAQTTTPPTTQPAPAPATDAAAREAWRAAMARVPVPKTGCFHAEYPKTEWQEVPCGRPSPYPNQPRPGTGHGANLVGNGADYAIQTSGVIASATGSFLPITNVTGVSGVSGNVTQFVNGAPVVIPNVNNVFMLQINTQSVFSNPPSSFNTPACNGAPNGAAGCFGWQQYLFSQT